MNIDQHVLHPLSTWFLLSLLKSSEVCKPHMNHHQSSSIYLILFLFSIAFHFSTKRREKSAVSSLGYSCQWLAIASTCAAGGSLKGDMAQEPAREGWWTLSWGTFPYGSVPNAYTCPTFARYGICLLLESGILTCKSLWVHEYRLQCVGLPLQK